jgi:hypothetical protein
MGSAVNTDFRPERLKKQGVLCTWRHESAEDGAGSGRERTAGLVVGGVKALEQHGTRSTCADGMPGMTDGDTEDAPG